MDQDEPGRNSPHSGGQKPVSTVRSYSRLRSYTGHGNLTYMTDCCIVNTRHNERQLTLESRSLRVEKTAT